MTERVDFLREERAAYIERGDHLVGREVEP